MARPQNFDRFRVLDQAVKQFWESGYAGTSMEELDRVTGLNRGSIYNAFGDKKGLYLEALNHYGQLQFGSVEVLITGTSSPREAVAKVFEVALEQVETGKIQRGCLICNAAVEKAPTDSDVKRIVRKYLNVMTRAFISSLRKYNGNGDPQTEVRIEQLAAHLTASYMGFNVVAKAGLPLTTLEDITDSVIAMVSE